MFFEAFFFVSRNVLGKPCTSSPRFETTSPGHLLGTNPMCVKCATRKKNLATTFKIRTQP